MSVNDNLFIFFILPHSSQALSRHIECIHAPIWYLIKLQRIRTGIMRCYWLIWFDCKCSGEIVVFFSLRLSIATRFHLWHFIRSHSCVGLSHCACGSFSAYLFSSHLHQPDATAQCTLTVAVALLLSIKLATLFFQSLPLPENQQNQIRRQT